MGRVPVMIAFILVIGLLTATIPPMVLKTSMNQSELSRFIDTSDAIYVQLETACINALESNLDYNAKANGVVTLKPGHTVESDIINEVNRVMESYIQNNNFEDIPVVTINSIQLGGASYTDADGRNSNFNSVGSSDVTVDGFTGAFPTVSVTIKYRFRSVLSNKTRPSVTQTAVVELNHTNILQNNWND